MHGLAFEFVYVGKKVRVAFEGVVVIDWEEGTISAVSSKR